MCECKIGDGVASVKHDHPNQCVKNCSQRHNENQCLNSQTNLPCGVYCENAGKNYHVIMKRHCILLHRIMVFLDSTALCFHTHVFISKSGFNSSPPEHAEQNGHHFANNIFRCIFVNVKFCILIKVSLGFVPRGTIDNNPTLV